MGWTSLAPHPLALSCPTSLACNGVTATAHKQQGACPGYRHNTQEYGSLQYLAHMCIYDVYMWLPSAAMTYKAQVCCMDGCCNTCNAYAAAELVGAAATPFLANAKEGVPVISLGTSRFVC